VLRVKIMDIKGKGPSTLVMISRDGMGSAELELRHKLLRIYLTMLKENGLVPGAICFYAEGVKMVVQGSPVLDLLRELEERGVHLIACTTCLQHYGLADQIKVGIVGGMHDIVLAQWAAEKVITL